MVRGFPNNRRARVTAKNEWRPRHKNAAQRARARAFSKLSVIRSSSFYGSFWAEAWVRYCYMRAARSVIKSADRLVERAFVFNESHYMWNLSRCCFALRLSLRAKIVALSVSRRRREESFQSVCVRVCEQTGHLENEDASRRMRKIQLYQGTHTRARAISTHTYKCDWRRPKTVPMCHTLSTTPISKNKRVMRTAKTRSCRKFIESVDQFECKTCHNPTHAHNRAQVGKNIYQKSRNKPDGSWIKTLAVLSERPRLNEKPAIYPSFCSP